VLDLVFWSYLLCLSFFGFAALGFYRSYSNICVRNFMSFESILRNIQTFKVLVLVLKLVSFESDNFLWSY